MKTASIYILAILVLGLIGNPILQHTIIYQDKAHDNLYLLGVNAYAESDKNKHDLETNNDQTDNNQTDEDQSEDDQTDNNQTDEDQSEDDQTDNNQTDEDQSEDDQTDNNQTDEDQSEDDQTNSTQTKQQMMEKNSEEIITKLQQEITQLKKNLQTLIEKLQNGEYYGDISNLDTQIKSYAVTFEGTATSMDGLSTQPVTGELFIENLVTNDYFAKFKVTGGEIQVGQTTYDLAFGKVRVTSNDAIKNSMVLIGQVIDDQGNGSTIRMNIDSAQPLEEDFGQEPIDLQINSPQSKIAGQWLLEGNGKLSLS